MIFEADLLFKPLYQKQFTLHNMQDDIVCRITKKVQNISNSTIVQNYTFIMNKFVYDIL